MHSPSSSLNSNQWFVCPQPNPKAETRLFFFPYAGGGPAVFNKWAVDLPANIEARIAHYPGRGSRYNEPPIKELAVLVEKIFQTIQPLLDKPFAFFGHSLGGLVAFELARTLHQNNLPQPTALFISACDAPHILDHHLLLHNLPDAQFLTSLKELNGIPAELLNQPDVMQLLMPTLRADFELIETYRFAMTSPLNCPVLVFGGLDDPRVSRERLEGWAIHANAHFELKYFPGDHFFIHTARKSVIAEILSVLDSTK
ncbi:MAG: thioesterase [Anaerolineales bacterium]|nr:thioesterase [Anaerolineales bacterium]